MKSDNIDKWVLYSLLKTLINAIQSLIKLLSPKKSKPSTPIIPLPDKPIFPWLRKKIDNVIPINKENKS